MPKRILPFFILLILTLACSGTQPGVNPTPDVRPDQAELNPSATIPPTLAATGLPTFTSTPAPTPTPTPDPVIQIGEVYLIPDFTPSPSDYLEVFERKLEAGEWTTEQGLVAMLKIFTGELDGGEALGDTQPEHPEIGGILVLASEYLENGSDPAAKEEIQRLLDILIPRPERLLPYAQPQPESASFDQNGVFLTSFNPRGPFYQDDLCTNLATRGFPPGDTTLCIQYTQATLVNGIGTVYYPIHWWPDDPNLAYVLAATEALVRSAEVYSQFGQTASVDLVFGIVNKAGPNPPLAVAPYDYKENCLIVMYPESIQAGNERGMSYFQQTVAHEMFHCLQHWNFSSMQQNGYNANKWWIEGSAEYFSNVVYPTANAEWEFVPAFDKASVLKSIFEMDYHNTVFFQYLQNVIGDQAIVDFLKSIPPSSSPQVSAEALAAYPDIQTIFHNFAQAWADKQIIDSGGAFLPNKLILTNTLDVDGSARYPTTARSFVLRRDFWRFVPENLYQIAQDATGPAGLESARPAEMPLLWATLPSNIDTGCGTSPYILLSTTTSVGNEPREASYEVTTEADPECDLCVVGTWQFDLEQFISDFVATLYQDENLQHRVDEMSGSLTLKFTKEGVYRGIYDNLIYTYSVLTPDAFGDLFGVQTTFHYTGQSYGTYQTGGQKLSVFDGVSTVIMQAGMGGNFGEPREQSGVGFGPGKDVPYTCTETELVFERIDGATGVPLQYRYTKTSKPLWRR